MASSTIIVHGGAGDWPELKQAAGLSGVRQAATRGFRLLQRGGSALHAVEAAVMEMEDNPVFNASRGSTLNLVGDVERPMQESWMERLNGVRGSLSFDA